MNFVTILHTQVQWSIESNESGNIFSSLQKEYSWEYFLRILMGQLFLIKAPNCILLLEW